MATLSTGVCRQKPWSACPPDIPALALVGTECTTTLPRPSKFSHHKSTSCSCLCTNELCTSTTTTMCPPVHILRPTCPTFLYTPPTCVFITLTGAVARSSVGGGKIERRLQLGKGSGGWGGTEQQARKDLIKVGMERLQQGMQRQDEQQRGKIGARIWGSSTRGGLNRGRTGQSLSRKQWARSRSQNEDAGKDTQWRVLMQGRGASPEWP